MDEEVPEKGSQHIEILIEQGTKISKEEVN
jgi:hypothetical protein